MAVQAQALTTLASAHRAIGVPTADTSNDTLIEELIDAATEWIQEQCNRKLVRRNYNRAENAATANHSVTSVPNEPYYWFSGDGVSRTHVLPNFPVDSASFTLEELQSRATNGTETWSSTGFVTDYDYIVHWSKGIIQLINKAFTSGVRNYRVTYEAGFEDPENSAAAPWVPKDLQRCCNEIVRNMWQGDKSRVSSEKIGTWTRTYDLERDNPLVEPVLEKYKSEANLL